MLKDKYFFIPVANPKASFEENYDSFIKIFDKVLTNGMYILDEEVQNFEKEFATYIGTRACVGVASGTDAISMALSAVGISTGDEVITVSHTAVATIAAIERIFAIPVFADIDPLTKCIDPNCIQQLISPKTKAILPVHIYGHPSPMREILAIAEKFNLKIVEDCAQAHGAKIDNKPVGSFGHASAFSFYPTKNLGALGDGGAIVSNDQNIVEFLRALRQYGWKEKFMSSFSGYNSRLDELQAGILRIKLKNLESENKKRFKIAEMYSALIKNDQISKPFISENFTHAMHLYVIEATRRDDLAKFLAENKIGTAIHYPVPVHLQKAYYNRIRGNDKLKNTETMYNKILSLPMYPQLSSDKVEYICKMINRWI